MLIWSRGRPWVGRTATGSEVGTQKGREKGAKTKLCTAGFCLWFLTKHRQTQMGHAGTSVTGVRMWVGVGSRETEPSIRLWPEYDL